ncbi:MAG: DUF2029 domain-containing protein [Anaerolineales bacterium]|nr:DUF2029 domain-containing protein [Anaerolineales bacterium]
MVNFRFVEVFPGGSQDFLDRWTGARKWVIEGVSPYDPEVTTLAQQMIYGRPARPEEGEDLHHFVYPFHSMLFFAPFGFLDFPQARTIWMTLLEISLIGLALISYWVIGWKIALRKKIALVVFSMIWVYGAHTLLVGQFAGLNAFLIIWALWAIQQRKDIGAGILLALTTAKPQMVILLIPFLFVWAVSQKRWYFISAFIFTSGILLGLSLFLLPSWPQEMWQQLSAYPDYAGSISPVEMIGVFFPALAGWGTNLMLGAIIVLLLWSWWVARHQTGYLFLWTALLTIVVTDMIIPRTATSNFAMMLPAFFLILKRLTAVPRWGRGLSVLAALIFFVGGWGLFLAAFVNGILAKHLVFFPLPIFCFLGLLWSFPNLGKDQSVSL